MKRRHGLMLAAALSFGAASTGARAQDASAGDVRCLVVGLYTASGNDADQRTAGMMMTAYYLGRLDGRMPDLDLKTRLADEVRKLTTAQLQAEGARCSADMTTRAKAMDALAGILASQGGAPPAN